MTYIFVEVQSKAMLSICLSKIVIRSGTTCPDYIMDEERTQITEVFTSFALSERYACWQSVDHPRTCLNNATLSNWKILIELVNTLSKLFIGLFIETKVYFSGIHEIFVIGEVIAEEYSETFSTKKRLAYPVSIFGNLIYLFNSDRIVKIRRQKILMAWVHGPENWQQCFVCCN